MAILDDIFGPLVALFVIGVSSFLLSLWYSIQKQSYWKVRNVPYVKPLPFVGNLLDIMKKPLCDILLERHFSVGPTYGHFEGLRPVLTVGDPKLLRDLLVKDFAYFPNRRTFNTGDKIIDQMLPGLEGEDWKRIRAIITPTFTTGKLKRVLSIFKDCSKTLVQNFKVSALKNEPINAKSLFGAFTMDVIASSAFSTKIDSHNDPENRFVQRARTFFGNRNPWKRFMTRNDFLQLLMDVAEETNEKKDDVEDEDITANYGQDFADQKISNTAFQKNLTMDELVSQCVIFFLAGYETTATLLSYVLYCLATNKDVQEKAYQEVKQLLQETNGELTYEVLHNLKYMDNIISETLRLYPPVVRTERKVEKDCKLGEISLEKGVAVEIPVFALHRDPTNYPNPQKFDPERFTVEERAKRDSYVYLPFGHGPRNCIGMRFALLEAKVCLAHVISYFNVTTCPQTKIPVEFDPQGYSLLQPMNVTVALEIRNECLLNS